MYFFSDFEIFHHLQLYFKCTFSDLGWGHMNYNIQIIAVILKMTIPCVIFFNNDLELLEQLL